MIHFDPIAEFLLDRPVMILDGALATELEGRGADLVDPLWSAKMLLERPELIRAVHLDYFRAGADVATTATYQATFEAFARRGLSPAAAARLMLDAVRLALEARDEFCSEGVDREERRKPLVAASIGPYGAFLADGSEYRGHYSVSDRRLREFHAPRLAVLAESGADLLACETIPCLREALVLAELLQAFPGMTAWISFSCRDGMRNCEGEEVSRCAAALDASPQVSALGVNCTAPGFVSDLLRQMQSRTNKPLLAYPNSGEHYDAGSKHWHGPTGERSFAASSQEWYAAGARLLGGCCRTTPDDIRALYVRYAAPGVERRAGL